MEVTLISTDSSITANGLRVFASMLKKSKVRCNCIFMIPPERNGASKSLYPEKSIEQACRIAANSDIVGVSSVSISSRHAIEVLNAVKESTRALTVWGGIHATTMPEECIKFADVVCIGEGEGAFLDLVNAMLKRRPITRIKNLWVNKNGKVFRNPARNLLENLDSLPFPSFDLDKSHVLEGDALVCFEERHLGGKYLVSGSRGCPHSCTYCCNALLQKLYLNKGKSVRFRSIENLILELEQAVKKFPSINEIIFTDDVFIIRPKEELEKFSMLYREKIRLPFQYYVSPLTISEEKLKILVGAGQTKLAMGIQSGSERVNFEVYKRFTSREKILHSAEIIHKYSGNMCYPPVYDLIIFNPYERAEDVIESIRTVSEIRPPFVISAYILAFFPGTELYCNALSEGKISNDSIFALDYLGFNGIISIQRPDRYLNSLVYLMSGRASERIIGAIPRFMLGFLTNRKVVAFNEKFPFIYLAVLFIVIQKRTLPKKILGLMPSGIKKAIKLAFGRK